MVELDPCSRNCHHRVQEVPFYFLARDLAGKAIRDARLSPPREKCCPRPGIAPRPPETVERNSIFNVFMVPADMTTRRARKTEVLSLAPVVEPNLVLPAADRLYCLHGTQVPQHSPSLDRARD